MSFTACDKLTALERELKYRRIVYARRVTEGKMLAMTAKVQIAVMEAIADDYRAPAADEKAKADLFGMN